MSKEKKVFSRRKFLKTAGVAWADASLAGRHFQESVSAATYPGDAGIPFRPFGRTGVSVPIIGFGGSQNLESKQRLLRQAIKLGVTYWDTAESYTNGGSEKAMGKYLKKYPEDRKKLFLVTKSDETRPSGLSQSLDNSLKRLNSTYIDLLFVHSISNPDIMDKNIRSWAEQAKAEGKRWKLIGSTKRVDGKVVGSVAPVKVSLSDPLAGVMGATNALTFSTDLMGDVTIVGAGAGKVETGFSMLVDLIDIHCGKGCCCN